MNIKYIIITSVASPTKAVVDFSSREGWNLIVVGDKKTPEGWYNPNTFFLSTRDQELLDCKTARVLPWNHYSRKMLGYIHAIRNGAEVIHDTDDDNIPKPEWDELDFEGEFLTTNNNLGFINIYKNFTSKHIWPRGFPLNLITSPASVLKEDQLHKDEVNVGVWQYLADGDPDVDAIYRLTCSEACFFLKRRPIVLGEGTLCPFNSQNTFFCKEVFPLLYLPSTVTFRFTDILRGLVAQPIMWSIGKRLGFSDASVIQERNPHNYLEDFKSEIPCYLLSEKIVDITIQQINSGNSLEDNLFQAYKGLFDNGIVERVELDILTSWLEDLKSH